MKPQTQHIEPETVTEKTVILVGNPNVGKSVLFQHLTGKYVVVSNYPGTTVDISTGSSQFGEQKFKVIDTPGTHSLSPKSEDEKVTRDVLLQIKPECILQVADAKNLKRSLVLTLQLVETGLPLLISLNMSDEAKERGIKVDFAKLSKLLGIPVIESVAVTGTGVSTIRKSIPVSHASIYSYEYDLSIEAVIKEIVGMLPCTIACKRSIALMLISGDESVAGLYPAVFTPLHLAKIDLLIEELQNQYGKPLSVVIAEQRQEEVERLITQVLKNGKSSYSSFQDRISRWTLHPVGGFFFAIFILYVMYLFIGKFAAGTLVDFFENTLFGQYIIPATSKIIHALIPNLFVNDMLVGEYGLISMALTYALALILPIVTAFFLFFGFLEDSGYLPRLAVMMDRLFRAMGLNGKAVLPMVLGLGCDTMATLTTRILETKKERVITTLLLTLTIPCSAQLGVILGMLAGLSGKATLLWIGMIVSATFIVGYLASLILPGEKSSFILEIPPIRMPKFSNLFLKTISRLEWYLKEAVPLFMIATFVLFIFDRFGILQWIEHLSAPLVVNILGLPAEAGRAFLIGFLRRDYGAAGLYTLAKKGMLSPQQVIVSLVTITLFVPCVAQFLVTIKERGWKTAVAISAFVLLFAFAAGGFLNLILKHISIL